MPEATGGTGVLYTLAAGLSGGARASVLAVFACTLGIVSHMLAAITSLGPAAHQRGGLVVFTRNGTFAAAVRRTSCLVPSR